MLFALYCLDKPFSTALRSVTRDAHLAYVAAAGEAIRVAGPLLSDDGEKMIGSLLILDMDDLEAARAWVAGDPYAKAGLFQIADIRPWRGRGIEPAPVPVAEAEAANDDAEAQPS